MLQNKRLRIWLAALEQVKFKSFQIFNKSRIKKSKKNCECNHGILPVIKLDLHKVYVIYLVNAPPLPRMYPLHKAHQSKKVKEYKTYTSHLIF